MRPRGQPAPFVTRRSTLGFSALSLAAGVGFQAVASNDSSAAGASGALTALVLSLWVVSGAVAWIAGVVLALRAHSLLWLVVAVLPFVPINSIMCAMFCPAPAQPRR